MIETYIQKLTLEEKAALLQGMTSWKTWRIPRLGIPSAFLSDGPHGMRKQVQKEDCMGINGSLPATCFPTAATVANSWDPALGEALGAALGAEAAACQVNVVLGPGLNLKRSPLCGRNFEHFSEDPYLAGKMAAGYIRGIQSKGVAACPKHFAANSQEFERLSTDSVMDERTLRELYLTGFEIAVKEADPKAIMTSYNPVNGVYANENAHLITELLKEQWGFSGFVMSDWSGTNDHTESVRAGSALEMPDPGFDSVQALLEAVTSGKLKESVLDDRLRELLPVVLSTDQALKTAPADYDREAHHRLCQACAAQSIVLLENDGILPLEKGVQLALIGAFAEAPRYQGAGSSLVNPTKVDNLKDCLEAADVSFTYAPGYHRISQPADKKLIDQAVETAKAADIVLLCIGLDEISETEGTDRRNMDLPQAHLALLDAVFQANQNVVLILSGGAPFCLPQHRCRAVVHGYLGGQAGAGAMAQVLLGQVNPSGKLAESWPLALEDTPTANDYPGTNQVALYKEGLFVGYRYYDTAGIPVRYPFGHGLSYTGFRYSDLTADKNAVAFTLTNTGSRDGAEIAQVYLSCADSRLYRPKKELKGFRKVFLRAGESRRVTVALDDKAFRYFNPITNRFEVETGNYDVLVAASVCDVRLSTRLRILGTEAPLPDAAACYRTADIKTVSDADFETLLGRPFPVHSPEKLLTRVDTVRTMARAKSPVARFAERCIRKDIQKQQARGIPTPITLYVHNQPFRSLAQAKSRLVTMKMIDDALFLINGHFFKGLFRLIRDFFAGQKARKAFLSRMNDTEE